jgi:membrane fusion protein (multidrug efflux system)
MKNKLIITAIAAGSIMLYSCHSPVPKQEQKTPDRPHTETFQLTHGSLQTDLKIPSEITAYQEVAIYAKVNSYIKTLKVDVGSHVRAGDLLATLDAPELLAQLAAAESKYKSQQAIFESSDATYQRILETSKYPGTIAKNDVDVALAKRNSDKAQMEAAKADYNSSRSISQYLTLRAPFEGVISARNVNLGAITGPAGGNSALPIFSLSQLSHLRLVIEVPEAYKSFISLNEPVSFIVKAFPDQVFTAKIARRAGVMDSRLRSEHVELDVQNPDLKLSPGMVAEAQINLNGNKSGYVVPKNAVVNSQEGIFLVQDLNGTAKKIPVRLGRVTDSIAEVFGPGLSAGSSFVKKANEELRDGTKLQ